MTSTGVFSISPTTEAEEESIENVREGFRRDWLPPLCVICVVGILANVTVIWNGLTKRVRFKHYSNYFILSLAFADLGVVLMAVPITIVEYSEGLHVSQTTCAFILPIREVFQGAAMQTIALLGLARLKQIVMPSHTPTSKRTSMILVFAVWLDSYLLISLPMAFVYRIYPDVGVCDPQWESDKLRQIHLTFIVILLCFPMVTVTISYFVILTKIKSLGHSNSGAESNVTTDVTVTNNDERVTRKSRNLFLLLVMLIIACWVSYAPLATITLLGTYEVYEATQFEHHIITVLFYSSSAVNPLLVLMMSRDYRFRVPRSISRKRRVANVHDHNLTIVQNH